MHAPQLSESAHVAEALEAIRRNQSSSPRQILALLARCVQDPIRIDRDEPSAVETLKGITELNVLLRKEIDETLARRLAEFLRKDIRTAHIVPVYAIRRREQPQLPIAWRRFVYRYFLAPVSRWSDAMRPDHWLLRAEEHEKTLVAANPS